MKQIVHIIDSLRCDGAQRMLTELLTRLDSQQFEARVIALTGSGNDYIYQQLQAAGIEVEIIQERGVGMRSFFQLMRLLKRWRPDIVHTHLFFSDVWGAAACKLAGVPVLVSTEHNINRDFNRTKLVFKRKAYRKCDAIIAISQAVKEYIVELDSKNQCKVRLIYNGIDLSRFSAKKTPTMLHQPPVISIIGRLEEQKGHAQAIAAFAQVKGAVDLHIIGQGSLQLALEQQVQQIGLKNRVQFLGQRIDIEQVYADSDIIFIPSRFEGFGLVAVEAMAAGKPIVASRVDGLAEILQHEKTALLVDMQQPKTVAQQIDRLLAEPTLRAHLGATAKQDAQRFDIAKTVEQYQQLYKELTT
ncbi:MAG: glycosyltransferase family 4 protein [Candidatus Kerfeldbacteria bacterium]|nr:glycosyltransferase family 4 protein [Candidatus Kerfeldbacteria bacterium]